MKSPAVIRCSIKIIVFGLLMSTSYFGSAQSSEYKPAVSDAKVFMAYLQNNWDDIHDVIVRFHYKDPYLKGIVLIQMNWQHNQLFSATIDSNSTGNDDYAEALVKAMNKWTISGLTENWTTTLPIKTEIAGSNDPTFHKQGILTGKVLDINEDPVSNAKLDLTPFNVISGKTKTFYTNREGIFIQTLIPTGDWSLVCTKDGYSTLTIQGLSFGDGEHVRKSIILKK
jgi:hypothetical protein